MLKIRAFNIFLFKSVVPLTVAVKYITKTFLLKLFYEICHSLQTAVPLEYKYEVTRWSTLLRL